MSANNATPSMSSRDRSLSPPPFARRSTDRDGETGSIHASGDMPPYGGQASSEKGSEARVQDAIVEGPTSKTGQALAPGQGMAAPLDAPDGGLKAWLQVLGAFLMFMNSWGIANSFGAYQSAYEEIGLSGKTPSEIAWIGSLQSCLLFLVSTIAGPLLDLGYLQSLHLSGAFLMVFGLMMTSIAKEYWQLMLAQGLVLGVGAGLLFVPAVATLATYFTTKRALAMGIAAAGSSVGGVVYPILLNKVRERIGLGWATRIIGFIALATFAISLSVMRSRLPPRPARALIQPRAFLEAPYSLFTLAMFFGFIALYIPFFFVTQYATEVIGVTTLAPYFLPIINAASTFGRIIPGAIADRTGPLNVLIPCATACAILTLSWIRIKDEAGIIVFCVLYGFFSGAFVSLPAATMAMISKDISSIGTRMGQAFLFMGLGVLPGTPIGGALVRGTDYTKAQIFTGVVLVVSACLMISARVAFAGFQLRRKA